MGLLGNKQKKDPFGNIASVVLIEQTQLYGKQNSWGLNFSNDPFGDPIVMSQNVPMGTELKFSVTYKNGSNKIIKAKSGTPLADKLLQLAIDPNFQQRQNDGTESSSSGPEKKSDGLISLQKNQLPNGRYIIGEDIPTGTFDFTWVYGSGFLHLFKNDENTTLGNLDYDGGWIGNQYDYEHKQCFNVKCEKGEMLVIGGTLIVAISRSKKVQIDL